MTQEAKAARAAYMREWRRRNKDKLRSYGERYWERKAQKAAEADHGEGDHR